MCSGLACSRWTHSTANRMTIQMAACLEVNAGRVVTTSEAIFPRMVNASPTDAARKNTQPTHVSVNVSAICRSDESDGTSDVPPGLSTATVRDAGHAIANARYSTPCSSPQTMNVQLAPCQ